MYATFGKFVLTTFGWLFGGLLLLFIVVAPFFLIPMGISEIAHDNLWFGMQLTALGMFIAVFLVSAIRMRLHAQRRRTAIYRFLQDNLRDYPSETKVKKMALPVGPQNREWWFDNKWLHDFAAEKNEEHFRR